jgi:hypothetical protein
MKSSKIFNIVIAALPSIISEVEDITAVLTGDYSEIVEAVEDFIKILEHVFKGGALETLQDIKTFLHTPVHKGDTIIGVVAKSLMPEVSPK